MLQETEVKWLTLRCVRPALFTLNKNITQTQTYRSQVRQLKVGSIHFKNVAPGFSKHIHTEAHPLL